MRKASFRVVDIATWVDSGVGDPVQHRLRRAAHILLAAIAGIHPPCTLYLKAGSCWGWFTTVRE